MPAFAARSRSTQNSLPSGSASTTQPLVAGLTDVDPGRARGEEPLDLGVLIVGVEVEVQPVLHRSSVPGTGTNTRPGKRLVGRGDHDLGRRPRRHDRSSRGVSAHQRPSCRWSRASTTIVHRVAGSWRTTSRFARQWTSRPARSTPNTPSATSREGFWDDESLGALLADGSARRGRAAVHRALRSQAVPRHARRRRRAGAPGRGRDARPRHRARRCGRVPTAELARSGGHVLRGRVPRRGRRADRALLRPEGGRLHPAQDAGEGAGHRRPLRPPGLPREPRAHARRRCPISNGSRSSATRRGSATTSRSPTSSPTSRSSSSADGRPALARARRVHVGHDRRTRRVSCTRTARSPPRSISSSGDAGRTAAGPAIDHRRAGRSRHRHARRAADRRCTSAARSISSTCGIPAACCRRCSTTDSRPARARRTSSRACSTIPTSIRRGTCRSCRSSGSAVRRCRPRSASAAQRSASRPRAASARPNTRRSPAARPTSPHEKRITTDGRPLPGVEIRLVDDDGNDVELGMPGEIWSRGPGLLRRLHRRRRRPRPRSGRRLVHDRRHRRARRRRLPRDHRPQEGHHHPRRRERQRAGDRGAARAHARRRRGRGRRRARRPARRGRVRVLPHATRASRCRRSAEIRAYLERAGLARQKWPEHVRAVDEFPRTASGKVQKFVLRQQLHAGDRSPRRHARARRGHVAPGSARDADARRPRRGSVEDRTSGRRPDAHVPVDLLPTSRRTSAASSSISRPRRAASARSNSRPRPTCSPKAGGRASRPGSGSPTTRCAPATRRSSTARSRDTARPGRSSTAPGTT